MKSLKIYFNRAVNTYEKAGKIQRKVADELLQKIRVGHYSTIVEIGSGAGLLSIPLIERVTFDRFIHIDISLDFLRKLREKLKGKHFFINAQAENIPIKQNEVNLLVSSSTLHWLSNPEKNFIELFRILCKGGRFYFSIFTSNSLRELRKVSEITGFGSVYALMEADFYVSVLQKAGFIFNYEIKTYKEKYSCPEDLLKFHKLTGTNYTPNKKFSGKGAFKNFCEVYSRLFGNSKGVYATYEVLFIEGEI